MIFHALQCYFDLNDPRGMVPNCLIFLLKLPAGEKILVINFNHQENHVKRLSRVYQVMGGRMQIAENGEPDRPQGRLLVKENNDFFIFHSSSIRVYRLDYFHYTVNTMVDDLSNFTSINHPDIQEVFKQHPDLRENIQIHASLNHPLPSFPGRRIGGLARFNLFTRTGLRFITNLSLRVQGFQQFPASIVELENLQALDLAVNQITGIPEEVFSQERRFVSKLEYLNLSNNCLIKLPQSICNLEKLNFLSVCRNHIDELPASLGGLKSLVKLCLTENEIRFLPFSILKISNLKCCMIRNPCQSEIPNEIVSFEKVPSLSDMAYNKMMKTTPHLECQIPKIFLRYKQYHTAHSCTCGNRIFPPAIEVLKTVKVLGFYPQKFNISIKACSNRCYQLEEKLLQTLDIISNN